MKALQKISERELTIDSPSGLPSFASFVVSRQSEPIPAVDWREQALLPDSAMPTRREAFARGRAAAHAGLRTLGLDDGPILAGPNREPLWPHGVTGAISHAAGFGVALVAPTAYTDGVGTDLEALHNVPDLWEHVPRPEERGWLEELEAKDREAAILALFSAKESIYKAFFPRVRSFFGFEQASLTPGGAGFVGRLVDGVDDAYPWERTFDVTCDWFGDLVLTSVVLPKTPDPAGDPK